MSFMVIKRMLNLGLRGGGGGGHVQHSAALALATEAHAAYIVPRSSSAALIYLAHISEYADSRPERP